MQQTSAPEQPHIPPPMRRKVKDSVFTSLFSERRYLFELYKALHPEDTTATAADITNVTIHNVLTDGMYNDLGFLLKDRLVILIEAQSTWSANIVVRSLLYLVKTYNAYFKAHKQNVYGTKLVTLPRPELYVIYTGKQKERPAYISLKETFFPDGDSALDVRAKVLYDGSRGDIINQYVTFVHVLTEQIQLHGRTQTAIAETVRICQNENVLKEYLEARRTELSDYIWDMTDEEIEEEYWNNRIEQAVEETTAAVTQQVTQSVSAEKARDTALKMLERGTMPLEDIAYYAGLPVEEVRRLSHLQLA